MWKFARATVPAIMLLICLPFWSGAAAPSDAVPPVIYVDDKGTPIPLPENSAEGLAAISQIVASGKFQEALEAADILLLHPKLTDEQRCELLYWKADMLYRINRDSPERQVEAIVKAGILAMTHSPNDPRNATICLRLGYTNLRAGNIPEARGYFTRLEQQYPRDENIPFSYFYWGEWHTLRGELREAAVEFERILRLYPYSTVAKDAAIGFATIKNELGDYKKAQDMLAYINTNWPRAYLERPALLEVAGDVAYHQGEYAQALQQYLLFQNLAPRGDRAAPLLIKIGDAHTRANRPDAARAAYRQAAERFPDIEGGQIGLMRLAELDEADAAGISGVFTGFVGRFSVLPEKIPAPASFTMGSVTVWALQDTPGAMITDSFFGVEKERILQLEPEGRALSSVNVFLVRAGGKNILIDTGFGGDGKDRKSMLLSLLEQAGTAPENVDIVLMTHLHLDHAGGLLRDNRSAFPKAEVFVNASELAYWISPEQAQAAPGLQKNFALVHKIRRAYGPRLRTFSANEVIGPGITALAASGHTPGHTAFLLATDGARILFLGDAVQAASLQLVHPNIYAAHDWDGIKAASSRDLLLGLAAAENIPVGGTHLPFPGIGRIALSGSMYVFSPGL